MAKDQTFDPHNKGLYTVFYGTEKKMRKPVGSYLDSVQILPFFTSSGFSHIYEDTNTLVGSYLDSVQIVPYNHKKHHTLPADVLPSASEDLFESPPLLLLLHLLLLLLLLLPSSNPMRFLFSSLKSMRIFYR